MEGHPAPGTAQQHHRNRVTDRPRGALPALCAAQTTSWGLLYYSLPVAVTPISQDTGWSGAAITAAFSAGLIVSALAGIRVGRLLDRRGPRSIMATGTIIGAASLVLVGLAPTLPLFFAAWLVAGIAQAAVLYQPAFAVITRWYGPQRVRPLTILTLVAGFASTVFAPLTAWLIGQLGWRNTYFLLALILAVVTLPLHFFYLNARWTRSVEPTSQKAARQQIRTITRDRRFRMLQATFTAATFTLFAVTFNIIPLLLARGMDYSAAAFVLGLIGAGQVAGRIGYTRLGTISPRSRTLAITGAGAAALWGFALLPGPVWALVVLALITGAVRGCQTLLQATAVADRWGTRNFGTINGLFAVPMTVAGALAPAAGPAFAGVLGGYPIMALAMAVLLTVGMITASRT